MEVEPIYCAEQIVVPPNLADVLKAYTKEVIRRQPGDLIDFSAKYFANLANVAGSVQGTPAPKHEQLHQVLERAAGASTLTAQQLGALCSQAGIAKGAVAKILEAGRFDATAVGVDKFIFLLLAMSCSSFGAVIKGLFDVFSQQPGGSVKTERFITLVSHLAPDMDPEISPALLEELKLSLEGLIDVSFNVISSNGVLQHKL